MSKARVISYKEAVDIFEKRCTETISRRYGESFDVLEEVVGNLVSVLQGFVLSGLADKHFLQELVGKESTFSQRIAEALAFERLTHAGFKLSSESHGPDFLAQFNGEKVWIELVTPSRDQGGEIQQLEDAYNPLSPDPQQAEEAYHLSLLRVTNAISEKIKVFRRYREEDIVKSGDACIIWVNDAMLCPDSPMYGVKHCADCAVGGSSLVEQALLGVDSPIWIKSPQSERYSLMPRTRSSVKKRPKSEQSYVASIQLDSFRKDREESSKPKEGWPDFISAVQQVTLREDYGLLMFDRKRAEERELIPYSHFHGGHLVRNSNAETELPFSISNRLLSIVNWPPISAEESASRARFFLEQMIGRDSHEPK